jgi:hypothetical protein
MKTRLVSIALSFFFCTCSFAQIDISEIFNIGWDMELETVKAAFYGNSFSEKKIQNYYGISFNTEIVQFRFEVGFLFSMDHKLIGKALGHIKVNEKTNDKVYKYLFELSFNKFGPPSEIRRIFDTDIASWKSDTGDKIYLSRGEKTIIFAILKG